MPVKTGIQKVFVSGEKIEDWTPAFAGVTEYSYEKITVRLYACQSQKRNSLYWCDL